MSTHDQAQDEELREHEGRLEELEDRLSTTFPMPDTRSGAAQRFRFAVPKPSTVVTFGARGTATSEGQAIGPGGLSAQTSANLAMEIQQDAIVDVAGATTLYADGVARVLSSQDLGLSGYAGARLGTHDGDLELTAGQVALVDPSFTVIPSMDIPAPDPVDTASPRSATETSRSVWSGVWMGLTAAQTAQSVYQWFTGWIDPPGGHSPSSILPQAATIVGRAVSALGVFRALVVPAVDAALSAAADAEGAAESSEPKVHIHGVGGVEVSSPHKTRMFGVEGASVESPKGAKLAGGLAASVKSPVKAQLYGGLMAALKSEVIAKVSGRFAVLSGDYAEVRGKEAAALAAGGNATISSGGQIALDAPNVAVGARSNVHVSAGDRTWISSRLETTVSARERVRNKVEQAQVILETDGVQVVHESTKVDVSQSDGIRLDPGGGMQLTIDRRGMRARMLRFTSSEVTLRGRINLG